MPETDYVWLPRHDLLTFEEIGRLVDVFGTQGVHRVRLTGGEPLLRRDLPELIARLAARPVIRDLALTTNGVLLEAQAASLRQAGLHRITVSLDTLRPDRFERLTRFDKHASVLRGLDAALTAGFDSVKLDTVVIRGLNDDELVELVEFGRSRGVEVRFIEYMDVGGATRWSAEAVMSRSQMLEALGRHYGPITRDAEPTAAPADRYRLPDGTVFGIISSTTEPFCRSCDRSRLTADGLWYLCLYAAQGIDLRGPLRAGASPAELEEIIATGWQGRADRGAEARLATLDRAALLQVARLRQDSHLEMHTRGG
jgi:cyclic pyranopterin phosphate synthase